MRRDTFIPLDQARAFGMRDWPIYEIRSTDEQPSLVLLIGVTALLVSIPNLIVGFLIGMVVTF